MLINKKNCVAHIWFIYKVILYFLYKILGLGIRRVQIVSGLEIEIDVLSKNLFPLNIFLKKHSLIQCKSLMDVICYDTPSKIYRFSIIYNLLSVNYNLRIRVISKISEFVSVLSLVSLFKSISWSEREVFDFFGVFFILNNDLRRILTDYGFKGFPLRKDFPLTGFVETYYDDNQKRICYKNIEFSQEYRNFKIKSTWKFN